GRIGLKNIPPFGRGFSRHGGIYRIRCRREDGGCGLALGCGHKPKRRRVAQSATLRGRNATRLPAACQKKTTTNASRAMRSNTFSLRPTKVSRSAVPAAKKERCAHSHLP